MRHLFIFIIIVFMTIYAPIRLEAFFGDKVIKTVGEGAAGTAKGVGKAIYWTGKGMYKIAEFLVVEISRPITAIMEKIIDVYGVPVEE